MGIKAKLGMSVATGVLAFGLIGGGTYAYFSDSVSSVNTFASGKMDISLKDKLSSDVNLKLEKLVPGDSITRDFVITNDGTVNISTLFLKATYTGDSKFAESIVITLLENGKKPANNMNTVTLKQLSEMTNSSKDGLNILALLNGGNPLEPNHSTNYTFEFEFVDDGTNQKELEDNSLALTLGFEARTVGSKKKN